MLNWLIFYFVDIFDHISNQSKSTKNLQTTELNDIFHTAWSIFDEVTSIGCSRNCSLSFETLIKKILTWIFSQFKYSFYQTILNLLILLICSFNKLVKADWNWLNIRWSNVLQSHIRHTLGSPMTPNKRRDPLVINIKRFRKRFNIWIKRWWYSRNFSGRQVN